MPQFIQRALAFPWRPDLHLRSGPSRVSGHAERPGSRGGQAALQLIGEQEVGQLALGVPPGHRVAPGAEPWVAQVRALGITFFPLIASGDLYAEPRQVAASRPSACCGASIWTPSQPTRTLLGQQESP